MMKNKFALLITGLTILLLAACAGTPGEEPAAAEPETAVVTEHDDEMMADDSDEMMADDSDETMAEHDDEMMADNSDEAMAEHDDEMMAEDSDEMMTDDSDEMMAEGTAAWQQIALTNAQTGEQFTFADFAGKTIYVEPMATWCTNCRQQLTNVSAATSQFNDDVVFVALSVEVGLNDSELADYAAAQGFPFTFAVINEALLRELVNEFGQSIANPPATPHFVIRTDGTTTELFTGIESTDEIAALIQSEIQ